MFVDAAELLLRWGLTIASVYALLAAIFLATCLIVTRLNCRIAAAKIQPRIPPPAQIRRDRTQSLLSLAAIAAMFGTGHFLYVEFGWGLRPWGGIAGAALSLLLSL